MASIVDAFEEGQQLDLGRENWLSSQVQSIAADAAANPKIGPERTLAFILYDGLGLSLNTIAQLTGVTKSMVDKRVSSGRKRIRLMVARQNRQAV